MLKVGLVGLPNAGKSTLFNALVKGNLAVAANYPFCTIEPNVGMVEVPDARLQQLATIVNPAQVVPAAIQFIDIAGLVEGAHKGEGLGNAFLAHIKETDMIAVTLRAFSDRGVSHIYGNVDPVRDYETLMLELVMSDLMATSRVLERARKAGGERLAALTALNATLEKNRPLAEGGHLPKWDESTAQLIRELGLLTAKPRMIVLNGDEATDQAAITDLGQKVSKDFASDNILFIDSRLEAELLNVPDEEQQEWLASYGVGEPGLTRLIRQSYARLNLQSFFTAGPKEVRAWTIPVGATAQEAAGVIHTDFYERFIRAEVIGFGDFITAGGEIAAREAGRLRAEGRDYLVQDGDILHIRFSPS